MKHAHRFWTRGQVRQQPERWQRQKAHNVKDNLHVSRKQIFKKRDRPFLYGNVLSDIIIEEVRRVYLQGFLNISQTVEDLYVVLEADIGHSRGERCDS